MHCKCLDRVEEGNPHQVSEGPREATVRGRLGAVRHRRGRKLQQGPAGADLSTRGMQLRFGRTHIRPLIDQLRGQAERQILRKLQRGELDLLCRLLARQTADQRHQQIALHRQSLLQRRQCGLRLRQCRFNRCNVGPDHLPELELLAQDVERAGLDFDDFFSGRDWPRNDASCTAAATTFEVRVRNVASS